MHIAMCIIIQLAFCFSKHCGDLYVYERRRDEGICLALDFQQTWVEINVYERRGDEDTVVHGYFHVRLYPIGFEPSANSVEIYVYECRGDEISGVHGYFYVRLYPTGFRLSAHASLPIML